jgi:hypothetical protein
VGVPDAGASDPHFLRQLSGRHAKGVSDGAKPSFRGRWRIAQVGRLVYETLILLPGNSFDAHVYSHVYECDDLYIFTYTKWS